VKILGFEVVGILGNVVVFPSSVSYVFSRHYVDHRQQTHLLRRGLVISKLR
jgi:hypothetical protein